MENQYTWHLKFYGTRGSTPVCESGFQIFGGNTTSIYVKSLLDKHKKSIGIIDAGTGIRKLGKEIAKGLIPNVDNIFILFTHFHWDHIQGLPFFEPAYKNDQKIIIFSPQRNMENAELKNIFEVQNQEEYFPIQLDKMGADFTFVTQREDLSSVRNEGGISFGYRLHNHPGGAFSYAFEENGKKVVVCTDLEHGEFLDMEVVEFCEGADLLVHDAQYTDEELKMHRGWGHSSYAQAIEVAKRAGVKQLIFTHHDPDHNDDFLHKMEIECQKKFPNCKIAKDGMEIFI